MSLQLSGLVGGFVATIVMTAVMMAVGDGSPPPSAALWAKFVGDGSPEDSKGPGMILHLLYGTGAGWVYALLGVSNLIAILSIDTLVGGIVNGAIYGILLMIVAVGWVRGVIGMDPEPKRMGVMALVHVVYGVVLGAWIGLGILV